MASSILPEPRMQIVSRIENKVYCDICERSWLKKNNKLRKYVTGIDQDKFKGRAFEWKHMSTSSKMSMIRLIGVEETFLYVELAEEHFLMIM